MYKVTFNDNTSFQGGEFYDSKWNEMPSKQIQKLEYWLGDKILVLEGYEAYNHHVQWTVFPFRKQKIKKPLKIMLMAKRGNEVLIFSYNLTTGKLDATVKEFGKEYYGKPTTGWKEGLEQSLPKSYLR